MKRFAIFAIVVVALVSFSLTTGCGKSTSNPETQEEPVVQDLNISGDTEAAAEDPKNDDDSGPDINGPDNSN